MHDQPADHETPPEPRSTTSEKPPIRKSQEEFIDESASHSKDKSEYAPGQTAREQPGADA